MHARKLNLLGTARLRARGQRVSVSRNTTVNIAGSIQVRGSLVLGRVWSDSGVFSQGYLIVTRNARLEVDGHFEIHTGLRVVVDPGGVLKLGSGYINDDVRISCFSEITIGNDVAIAEQVMIRDSDNHDVVGSTRSAAAPITIGDHVWIGSRVTILKGVTIGDGAIIAAGAVVNRDVPTHTLAAGIPARTRKEGVYWI